MSCYFDVTTGTTSKIQPEHTTLNRNFLIQQGQ